MVSGGDDEPTCRLGLVAGNVAGMQSALAHGDLAMGTVFADAVVTETTRWLDAIDELHPARDPERSAWEAELISALRVYRNAAFVYRRMAGVNGEPDPALGPVCGAMIEQGHDHWRALTGGSVARPGQAATSEPSEPGEAPQ